MWGLFSSFDYAKEWKAVGEQLNTNPKTVLSKVNSIEKHAKAEGNAPQQIRCIIERAKAKNYIEEGAFTKCLEEMKQFQQRTKDDVARSVATYMIGKLYLKYYHDDAYAINRRTDLGDYEPEDIMEWTSNIFIKKVREYSFGALSNEKLKTVPATDYEAILRKGEDSRIYCPTLYDLFLYDMLGEDGSFGYDASKFITSEEKEKCLKEWVAFHANDKERDAIYVRGKGEPCSARLGAGGFPGGDEEGACLDIGSHRFVRRVEPRCIAGLFAAGLETAATTKGYL